MLNCCPLQVELECACLCKTRMGSSEECLESLPSSIAWGRINRLYFTRSGLQRYWIGQPWSDLAAIRCVKTSEKHYEVTNLDSTMPCYFDTLGAKTIPSLCSSVKRM